MLCLWVDRAEALQRNAIRESLQPVTVLPQQGQSDLADVKELVISSREDDVECCC